MQKIQEQDCPLCGTPAEFEYRDSENRKHFWCKKCVRFEISRRAESRLGSSTLEWRSQCSEKAQNSNEKYIWVITSPRQEDIVNAELHGEYVIRS